MARKGTLSFSITADISDFQKKLEKLEKKINSYARKMDAMGKGLSTALTVPLAALGTVAVKAGLDVEKALKTIRIGTGATGEALKGLNADFKAIAASVPNSLGETAQAIADINTLTGATGKTLQDFATAALDASRMMGTSLGGTVSSVGKLLNNWNLSADQGVTVLDKLFYAAQSTGMGLDAIAQSVTGVGSSLREMGFSLDESIALVSSLDKAGVGAATVTRSLSRALANMAKAGITDSATAFRSIVDSIKNAETQSKATAIAVETFGAKAGPQLAASIREGRLEIANFADDIRSAGGTVAQTAKDTEGFSERWGRMVNQMTMALEPLGTRILALVAEDMEPLSKAIGDLSINVSDSTIKWAAYAAALGPVLIYTSALIKSGATLVTTMKTLAGIFSGPVGLTVAIGAAMVGLSSYIDTSGNVITITDETRASINDLTRAMQNATAEQLRSQLASISAEMEKMGAQARAAHAEIARLEMFKIDTRYADAADRAAAAQQNRAIAGNKQTLEQAEKYMKQLEASKKRIQAELDSMANRAPIASSAPVTARPVPIGRSRSSGGSSRSSQSAIDSFVQSVQDRMRYLKDDGLSFMDTITAMQGKLKPLSEDWKKLEDLRLNIDSGSLSQQLQEIQDRIRYLGEDGANFIPRLQEMAAGLDPLSEKGKQVADVLKSVSDAAYSEKWSVAAWNFSEGLMSASQYAAMLEAEVGGLTEGTEQWRARFSELQNIKADELNTTLQSLSSQFENGAISSAEYESALSRLAAEFAEFPRAAKAATEALEQFQRQNDLTTVSVGQQLSSALRQTTKDFKELYGNGILGAVDGFLNAAIRGEDFGATLRKLGEDILFTTLRMIILNQLTKSLGGMFGFSSGGVITAAPTISGPGYAYASGGIIDEPTVFPMANGMGLMGEAGPEAIMPLSRDSSGRLGVAASGMGEPTVIINVENNTATPVQANQTGVTFDEQMQQFVVNVVLRDQAQNGPISRNYRRAMR